MAKVTVVRTTPAHLDHHVQVVRKVKKLPGRHRRAGQTWKARSPVFRQGLALGQVCQENWQELFRFPDEEVIDWLERRAWGAEMDSTGADFDSRTPAAPDDGIRRGKLDSHGADKSQVSPGQVFLRQRLHIQVHQLFVPIRGQHGGHGKERQRRTKSLDPEKLEGMPETPKSFRELRVDK